MASEARKIVESVLGGHMTAKVWTGIYLPVFPFNPQGFTVRELLPMMLYLFRWGHRRGRGKFNAAFSSPGGKPTIESVSEKLAGDPRFDGFKGEVGRAVLGDLLLTSALENRRHAEGHSEQVQRCFPIALYGVMDRSADRRCEPTRRAGNACCADCRSDARSRSRTGVEIGSLSCRRPC